MIFNSYIFVLLYFPLILMGYYFFKRFNSDNWAKIFLFLVSLLFCGSTNYRNLFMLLGSIVFNYILYFLMIGLSKEKPNRILCKILLGMGIVINLSVLLYYKYYNFCAENVNVLLGTSIDMRTLILPLGISFITFQQIAFLIDTYRGEIAKCSVIDYALFTSYFPHVSSGPILLHNDFLPLMEKVKNKINWDFFASGLYMFVMGLGKKVMIADTFAKAANYGYSNISSLNSTTALLVSISYSIQIYFDFSGYSDMAIGISRMLQLDLPINFNSPYKARTILEFWDRWHMTLTRFLSKYLYIPLGGSRKGTARTYVNTLIVFLCSGLWHGASWTFILWGALHGLFMIFTKCFRKIFNKIPDWINHLITLLFVNFTWILFRSESFGMFKDMMKAILKGGWGNLNEEFCGIFTPILFGNLGIPTWIWAIVILVIILFIVFKSKNVYELASNLKFSFASGIVVVTVVILCILSFSSVSIFVYSNF